MENAVQMNEGGGVPARANVCAVGEKGGDCSAPRPLAAEIGEKPTEEEMEREAEAIMSELNAALAGVADIFQSLGAILPEAVPEDINPGGFPPPREQS